MEQLVSSNKNTIQKYKLKKNKAAVFHTLIIMYKLFLTDFVLFKDN